MFGEAEGDAPVSLLKGKTAEPALIIENAQKAGRYATVKLRLPAFSYSFSAGLLETSQTRISCNLSERRRRSQVRQSFDVAGHDICGLSNHAQHNLNIAASSERLRIGELKLIETSSVGCRYGQSPPALILFCNFLCCGCRHSAMMISMLRDQNSAGLTQRH